MVQITQNLRLGGVLLRPLPVALPVGIEAVHVVDAGYVDPGTRIPVPVPRAAEVVARFEYAQSMAGAAEPVGKVEARNARADDDDIDSGIRPFCPGGISHQPIITCLQTRVLSNGILHFGPPAGIDANSPE